LQTLKPPNFIDFFVRVGGLAVVFAVSILITAKLFPGYESHVILAIASAIICYSYIKWQKKDK
jgi:hypothetical protein